VGRARAGEDQRRGHHGGDQADLWLGLGAETDDRAGGQQRRAAAAQNRAGAGERLGG